MHSFLCSSAQFCVQFVREMYELFMKQIDLYPEKINTVFSDGNWVFKIPAESRGQTTEDGGQMTEVGDRKSEVGNWKT